ncbi:MAG: glycoside hydrolase family 13, partial [Verrucomicrobia bacterium]
MQTLHTMRSRPSNSSHHGRYSARNMAKPTNFFCAATEAQSVAVVGDFNDWRPQVHPMQQQTDGSWHLQIPLNHGHHH